MVAVWLMLGLVVGCERKPEPHPPTEGARKHALLIVVDTLRAGAVQRASTPNLDSIGLRGGAASPCMGSGDLDGAEHGLDLHRDLSPGARLGLPDADEDGEAGRLPAAPCDPHHRRGALCARLPDHRPVRHPIVRPDLGFDRGFDHYTRLPADRSAAGLVAEQVADWDDDERHFLYLHLWGPHQPLNPSSAAQDRWGVERSWIRKRGFNIKRVWEGEEGAMIAYFKAYHAVVEDTDSRIGDILAALGSHRDDTVIIVTSDHGELLGEHGRSGHGSWVYEPLTWVPFIAEGAGLIPQFVSNAATADAISRGLGLDLEWSVRLDSPLPLVSQREGKVALSPDGKLKGIWDPQITAEEVAVFDLSVDPGEERPVAGQDAVLSGARTAWEADTTAGTISGEPIEVSDDMEEALRTLGYIE